MESVKTQDVSVNDLRWTIEYHAERCTMCGSCVAACTFNAIEAGVSHRSVTVSRKAFPEPAAEHFALPVIRQKTRIEQACVGCGICTTMCKFDAIKLKRVTDASGEKYEKLLIESGKNVAKRIKDIAVRKISRPVGK